MLLLLFTLMICYVSEEGLSELKLGELSNFNLVFLYFILFCLILFYFLKHVLIN